jgi:hypothetical protein
MAEWSITSPSPGAHVCKHFTVEGVAPGGTQVSVKARGITTGNLQNGTPTNPTAPSTWAFSFDESPGLYEITATCPGYDSLVQQNTVDDC